MNSSTEKPNAVLTGLRSKWSIGGLCVLVLLAMWLLLSGKDTVPEEPLLRISTIKADEVVLHPRARVSGSLVAKDSVEVGTALTGLRIESVLVEQGERVQQGQLLAELDSTVQRAQVQQAQASVASATAELQEKLALHQEAQKNLKRVTALSQGTVSAQTLDERRAQAQAAQATWQAAQAVLSKAQAELAEQQEQLDKTRIVATVEGLVLQRHAQAGAQVGNDALFTLAKNSVIELEGDVGEALLAQLHHGMPAAVQWTGQTEAAPGSVRLVSSQVDKASRMGSVRITLNAVPSVVMAGMFGRAELTLPSHTLAIAVPASAVSVNSQGEAAVMKVVSDGVVSYQPVRIGWQDAQWVEVVEGLNNGESVVATAFAFVKDGDHVEVHELERAQP
jgi:RND family efflux transporter MFP subunit